MTRRERGSTRSTVAPSAAWTQTAPAPTATAFGVDAAGPTTIAPRSPDVVATERTLPLEQPVTSSPAITATTARARVADAAMLRQFSIIPMLRTVIPNATLRCADSVHPVAVDEHLAERVRAALGDDPSVTEVRMFGGLAFLVDGHMACGIVKDELMVRLGAEGGEAALERPHVRPMDFTGRPMRTTVFVEPAGLVEPGELRRWVKAGVEYARSLPPKDARGPRPRRPRRPRA
jgi:hypothetical protein